jgi:hypothetical protein
VGAACSFACTRFEGYQVSCAEDNRAEDTQEDSLKAGCSCSYEPSSQEEVVGRQWRHGGHTDRLPTIAHSLPCRQRKPGTCRPARTAHGLPICITVGEAQPHPGHPLLERCERIFASSENESGAPRARRLPIACASDRGARTCRPRRPFLWVRGPRWLNASAKGLDMGKALRFPCPPKEV